MSRELTIGIVGTGRMAATMASAIGQLEGGRIKAVCSSDRDRGAAFAARFGIPTVHSDIGDFCADSSFDLVYVANASRNHAAACIAALNASKAVLCEKPFALSLEEGQRVAEAALRSGTFFMEGFWTLLLPAYQQLQHLVAKRAHGAAGHMQFNFGYPVHADDRARLVDGADGGLLFDRGGYGVALALQLLGAVEGVVATATEAGTVGLQLTHADGAITQIGLSLDVLMDNAVIVACANGAVGLAPPALGAERLWQRSYTAQPQSAPGGGLRGKLRNSAALRWVNARRTEPRHEWLPYGTNQFHPMLKHVIECLERGEAGSPAVPMSLSLDVLGVLDRARHAGARH